MLSLRFLVIGVGLEGGADADEDLSASIGESSIGLKATGAFLFVAALVLLRVRVRVPVRLLVLLLVLLLKAREGSTQQLLMITTRNIPSWNVQPSCRCR